MKINFYTLVLDFKEPFLFLLLIPLILYLFFKYKLNNFKTILLKSLYILISFLILLILTKLAIVSKTNSNQINLLVDFSDSLDANDREELIKNLPSEFKYNVIAFSEKFENLSENSNFTNKNFSNLNLGKTNLEQVLQNSNGPALLISDGYENVGDVENISNIYPIFPIIPETIQAKQLGLSIKKVLAPYVIESGNEAEVSVSIENSTSQTISGNLDHNLNGQAQTAISFNLPAENTEVKSLIIKNLKPGINEINLKLNSNNKTIASSQQTIFVSVPKQKKLLLLSGNESDQAIFLDLIKNLSFEVENILAKDQARIEKLDSSSLKAVILNNYKESDLALNFKNNLPNLVKSGVGLLMLGGNQSFGLGGYINSVIEPLLPVKLLPPQTEQKRLNLAVSLVLDKSGSMKEDYKIEYARLAAKAVIDSLRDEDYFGLIGFDEAPFILVPMGLLAKSRALAAKKTDLLFAAGATELLPAINIAQKQLERVSAGRKHMVILSDGDIPDAFASKSYYLKIVDQMKQLGITVSTFLIGNFDATLLKTMAESGGGAFYRVNDVSALPRLFLKDIAVTTGEKTKRENESYVVKINNNNRITSSEFFPELLGYSQTKRHSQVIPELEVIGQATSDPLLASWKVGQGQVIAYTSDANGRWSKNWINWNQYRLFWSEIINNLVGSSLNNQEPKQDFRYSISGSKLNYNLSVFTDNKNFKIEPIFKDPSGNIIKTEFSEQAPGNFSGSIPISIAGKYELQTKFNGQELTPLAFNLGGELFSERKNLGYNLKLLQKLAKTSGGKINPEINDIAQAITTQTKAISIDKYLLFFIFISFIILMLVKEFVKA